MRNKIIDIMTYVTDRSIDLLFIQETWMRKSDSHLLCQIREYGYKILTYRKPRRLDLGGGGALIYKKTLDVKNVKIRNFASFEHLECKLKTNNGFVNFINVYRPEYTAKNRYTVKKFLQHFSELLTQYSLTNMPLFLVGDYNIHVELCEDNHSGLSTSIRQKAKDANEFVRVLDLYALKQIIVGPTHELQGTLDLIITSIDHVSKMQDLQIGRKDEVCDSDHFSVAFSLDIEPIHQSKLTKIVKRDFSHLDKALFREEIGHQLSDIIHTVSNMDDSIKSYNCILGCTLDNQCPLTEQNIRNRPSQKWYTQN